MDPESTGPGIVNVNDLTHRSRRGGWGKLHVGGRRETLENMDSD
jgi:hypothetical protein